VNARAIRPRLREERGVVLVSGLLLSLAVLMVIGVAVDVGHAFIVRRELVAAADDAALSGSQQLDLDALHQGRLALDPQAAQNAALATLTGQQDVQAQASATSSDVSVRLERRFPTVLLRLVGLTSLTVSAQATAAPRAP
jgi:Flp pilus assembly protein TadG